MFDTYIAMTAALGTYGLISALSNYIANRKHQAKIDGLLAELKDSFGRDEEPEEES